MLLDLRTMYLVIVLAYFVFGLMQLVVWYSRRGEPALALWGSSNLMCGTGSLLIALQGPFIPHWLGIGVGNGLLLLGYLAMWAGLRRFAGQPFNPIWVWLPPIALAALYSLVEPIGQHQSTRVCLMASIVFLFAAACARDALRAQRTETLIMRRVAIGAFIATCVSMMIRFAATAGGEIQNDNYLASGPFQSLSTLILIIVGLVWNVSILLMASERLEIRLTSAALYDPLTSLLNRAGFRSYSQRQVARDQRGHLPTSLLLMDLDHFKSVNDEHGHEAGDQLLIAFAATARNAIRPGDLLARYGGEEFVALLSNAPHRAAMEVAERLRTSFEHTHIMVGGQRLNRTVSIGVTELQPGETIEAALIRADRALYAAKHQGRNRVGAAAAA